LSRVAGLATAMGVQSSIPEDDPQLTIGGGGLAVTPLDLAAAYGTLANLGEHVPTTPLTRIEDATGATVWLPDTVARPVLAPSAAHVTTEVLREVVERGTALAARVPDWEVAGKTGTTSDHADAWFVGYTPVLSTAVWLGHVEGRIPLENVRGIRRVTGGTLPARIFADFTAAALADVDPVPFALPDEEYVLVELDPATGLLAAEWCPGETQRVPRVLVPRERCPEPPPPPPPPPSPPPAPPRPEPAPTIPAEPADEGEDDGDEREPVDGRPAGSPTDPEPTDEDGEEVADATEGTDGAPDDDG
jgi:penicillin-binding protein 1A